MKSSPSTFRLQLVGLALLGLAPLPLPARQVLNSSPFATAALDEVSGSYQIAATSTGWILAGNLGEAATNARVVSGRDKLGSYSELSFRWGRKTPREGSVRVYRERPVAVFSSTTIEATPALPDPFPCFTTFPKNLHRFSYKDRNFAPPSFALEQTGTPWLLFDDRAHAAIISPAANFMVARMIGGETEIASGLNEAVKGLPAGFTHRTILVLADGINRAWDLWGRALTDLAGTKRPSNDADIGLRYLGYWTDNGAAYYYDYDRALGYAGTLEALVERYRAEGIPIRYLQLDSWWYYKTLTGPDGRIGKPKKADLPLEPWNRYGGLLKYEAHPTIFPEGMAAFQRKIGLPLITHNRWIDPASPYRQDYRIDGFAAVDPRWWHDIIGYISTSGVVCYEQDWLNIIYNHSPSLSTDPGASEAFTDEMAQAAKDRGLSVQYCMALPRYFLQGVHYDNLTTIRTSNDRFERKKWDWFLYTSRLAGSLGIWPWTDVFMSNETDNLIISTLSAGMVGIGDKIGAENKDNILRAVRADGVIVKPDAPLIPLDEVYIAQASGKESPMLAWTYTDHDSLRTAYVFGYNRGDKPSDSAFSPAMLGIDREVYVYDPRRGAAKRLAPGDSFTIGFDPSGTAYFVVAPIARSQICLIGDEGKFVSAGRQRISSLGDEIDGLAAEVTFAAGESRVVLVGYAPRRPKIEAVDGSAALVSFDANSGRFEAAVEPGTGTSTPAPGGDPIRQAAVKFSLPAL